MQNLDPPQFCHFKFNCIFAYINWMPHTNSNPKHDQSAFPGIFVSQIALRFVPVTSAALHVSLYRARGMSDKQFVYADRRIIVGMPHEWNAPSRNAPTV